MSNQEQPVYKPVVFSENLVDIVSITPWNGEPLPERLDWSHFLYESILVNAELKKPKIGLSHYDQASSHMGHISHAGYKTGRKIVEES